LPYSAYKDYSDYCYKYHNSACSSCEIDQADRGWFKRFHEECKDDECKVDTYPVVLAYAVICGSGWFLGGIFGIIGGVMLSKCWAIVAGIMFTVFYVIFIGLFAGAWVRIRDFEIVCSFMSCEKYFKKIKRSTYEFIGYSICSFILILFAILFSFIVACSMKGSTTSNRTLQAQNVIRPQNRSNLADAHLNQYIQSTTQYKNTNQSANISIQPNYPSTSEYLPEYNPQPLQRRKIAPKKKHKGEMQYAPNTYISQSNQYPLHSIQYSSTSTQKTPQEVVHHQNSLQHQPKYYNEY